MGDLARVREKVQEILARKFEAQLEPDGAYSITYGSTLLLIELEQNSDSESARVYLSLVAPVVIDLQPTPELFEFVATHSPDYFLGHLAAERADDGSVVVACCHTLLADYLDEDELVEAVFDVLASADTVDDEIQGRFGGKRCADVR